MSSARSEPVRQMYLAITVVIFVCIFENETVEGTTYCSSNRSDACRNVCPNGQGYCDINLNQCICGDRPLRCSGTSYRSECPRLCSTGNGYCDSRTKICICEPAVRTITSVSSKGTTFCTSNRSDACRNACPNGQGYCDMNQNQCICGDRPLRCSGTSYRSECPQLCSTGNGYCDSGTKICICEPGGRTITSVSTGSSKGFNSNIPCGPDAYCSQRCFGNLGRCDLHQRRCVCTMAGIIQFPTSIACHHRIDTCDRDCPSRRGNCHDTLKRCIC